MRFHQVAQLTANELHCPRPSCVNQVLCSERCVLNSSADIIIQERGEDMVKKRRSKKDGSYDHITNALSQSAPPAGYYMWSDFWTDLYNQMARIEGMLRSLTTPMENAMNVEECKGLVDQIQNNAHDPATVRRLSAELKAALSTPSPHVQSGPGVVTPGVPHGGVHPAHQPITPPNRTGNPVPPTPDQLRAGATQAPGTVNLNSPDAQVVRGPVHHPGPVPRGPAPGHPGAGQAEQGPTTEPDPRLPQNRR